MVLSNVAKSARSSLISSRTAASGGSCGGNKKVGLPPRIGVPINILNNKAIYNRIPPCCKNKTCEQMAAVRNNSVQRKNPVIY